MSFIEAEEETFWDVTYPEMQEQVNAVIEQNREVNDNYSNIVIYSAWNSDCVNNLLSVAVEGPCQFTNSKWYDISYTSPIVVNPTWLDLCVLANDMINETRDEHHCFLEAVRKTSTFVNLHETGFVAEYEFSMGS